MRPTTFLVLAPLLALPALAAFHVGNPVLDLKLTIPAETVQSADVDVEDLVMVACDSSETVIPIDDTIDLAGGWQQAIPEGDWCDVRLTGLVWDDAVGTGADGSWVLEIDHGSVVIDIDPGDGTIQLDQNTLVQGAVHAGNPVLTLTIQ